MSWDRYDDLVDRLQVVVDDLDQITFDQLREASAEGRAQARRRQAAHPGAARRREGDPPPARQFRRRRMS